MKILTKKDAKSLGLKRYFTGVLCKHGHTSERFVSTSQCIECLHERDQRQEYKIKRALWLSSPERKAISIAYSRKYYIDNKEAFYEYGKKNRSERGEEINARRRELRKRWTDEQKKRKAESSIRSYYRWKGDPKFRLSGSLRSESSRLFGANKKTGSTGKYLGCSVEEARIYLISKLSDGMTEENYGEWVIDHIVPLAAFDLSKEDERIRAGHYTNLRPLWAIDNLRKGAKIPDEHRQIKFLI